MKIYLCSSFLRQQEMREFAAELGKLGHTVTSTWLDQKPSVPDDGKSVLTTPEESRNIANMDWADLMAADTLVTFTESADVVGRGRGGRHVEAGLAFMAGKRIIVVGYLENVFHYLPVVEFFESKWDLLRFLEAEKAPTGD